MKNTRKNYFYKEAYAGNTEIFMYENGKMVESDIINDYNLCGYTNRLEKEGYTFAYPPEEVQALKNAYEEAKAAYEEALNNQIK